MGSAKRPPAPGGRPHVVTSRLTDHEQAWVAANRGTLSSGQFLVACLHEVQALRARDEHAAQLGETD